MLFKVNRKNKEYEFFTLIGLFLFTDLGTKAILWDILRFILRSLNDKGQNGWENLTFVSS